MQRPLHADPVPTERTPASSDPRSRIGRLASSLLRQTRAVSTDYIHLAVLDARSAAVRFAWMLAYGVVAAILIVTAWLALVAAGIVWMLGSGASWITALAVAAALNIVVAAVIAFRMRSMFTEPPFAATLRQLRGEDADRGEPS